MPTRYRSNLAPPVRADVLADEQGRKGKPPIILDERQLRSWARLRLMNVSEQDVATLLGCTVPQLRRQLKKEPFKSIWHKGPVETKVAVLRRQFELSQMNRADTVDPRTGVVKPGGPHPGSADMAKWLGKQYLGQAERSTSEITGKDGGALLEVSDAHAELISQIDRIAERLRGDKARVINETGERLYPPGENERGD
jgi:hypothetical protein